jgi:hypothetical protein
MTCAFYQMPEGLDNIEVKGSKSSKQKGLCVRLPEFAPVLGAVPKKNDGRIEGCRNPLRHPANRPFTTENKSSETVKLIGKLGGVFIWFVMR